MLAGAEAIAPAELELFIPASQARAFTTLMKFDSASRDGCTSRPTPKNRQNVMMSGRHLS